jgi:hypothetical protein
LWLFGLLPFFASGNENCMFVRNPRVREQHNFLMGHARGAVSDRR